MNDENKQIFRINVRASKDRYNTTVLKNGSLPIKFLKSVNKREFAYMKPHGRFIGGNGNSQKKSIRSKDRYPELTSEGRKLLNRSIDVNILLDERIKALNELNDWHGVQYRQLKVKRKYIVWLRKQPTI